MRHPLFDDLQRHMLVAMATATKSWGPAILEAVGRLPVMCGSISDMPFLVYE